MAFWLQHDTPDSGADAGTGGDGDGKKGSVLSKLGTFTFSGGFCLPDRGEGSPGKVGLEISRETSTGDIKWAAGVKCDKTGCQASFDSDFNLSMFK